MENNIISDFSFPLKTNVRRCPNCGIEVGDWDFCNKCGTNLKADIVPELVPPDPTTLEPISNENLQDDNIVVLTDEEGNEVAFEFLDLIQYRDKEYVVLLPNTDEADEVVILQLEYADDETESYLNVDNEYTLQAVFEMFKQRAKDDFDFID